MKIPLPQNFDPPKPLQIYDYHDLEINLFSSSLQPNQLTLQTLQAQQIIPQNWNLKTPIHKKPSVLHISFVEGLNISIFPGKILFVQKIIKKEVNLPLIISKFIDNVHKNNYHRLQIVIKRIITLPSDINIADEFMKNSLLNGSDWDVLGQKPSRRQVNYYYPDLSFPLMINVINFPLKNQKLKSKSCLLFRGCFDYQIANNSNEKIMSIIEKYHHNIAIFNQIIDRDLLNS